MIDVASESRILGLRLGPILLPLFFRVKVDAHVCLGLTTLNTMDVLEFVRHD
jgi:hypothetical protein